MTLFLALILQAASPPPTGAVPPRAVLPGAVGTGDALNDLVGPPIELIDFLGRRRLCADPGLRTTERRRLRCAALPGEERAWRTRFTSDGIALAWLDQAPRDFRMPTRLIATFDETELVRPRRTEQSGTDGDGRPYRLVIETAVDGRRSTRVSATYDNWPVRSFSLSDRDFPLIDLETLQVRVFPVPRDHRLVVQLRYGHPRGWCGEEGDDREQVYIVFHRTEIRTEAMLRTNCERTYRSVSDAAAR